MNQIKPVPNCPDYHVDAQGNLYSTKRSTEPRKLTLNYRGNIAHRITWRAKDNEGNYRNYTVHTAVLHVFKGPRPTPKHVARHLNGDRYDNRADNLAWGTQSDNSQDALAHGTIYMKRGAANPRGNARLTEWQARAIYQSKGALTLKQAMLLFNASQGMIEGIWYKEHWLFIHEQVG